MSLPAGSDEYAQSQVPAAAATCSGWQIAIVKIGVILALPAFIIGAQIGFSMGLARAAVSVAVGAVVLGVLSALTGTIGAVTRQSTALIIRYAFGTLGARLVSALLGATLIGFFAVTVELFGRSLAALSQDVFGLQVGASACIIGGGALMVLTSIYGFRGLKRLADVAVPVKLIGLMWVVVIALRDRGMDELFAAPTQPASLGVGISAVIGGVAVGATIFPDLTRFARTSGHAKAAAIGSYVLAFPLVLLLAAIPSIVTQEADLLRIMVTMSLGLPAFVFLVFAAWTTNTSNLYSASLGLSSLFGNRSFPVLAAAAGALGIALALFGITDSLMPFLVVLGVSIPPIAGVYLADFYIVRRQRYDEESLRTLPGISWRAFAAWGAGVTLGLAGAADLIRFTGVPAIDSILIAFVTYSLACTTRVRIETALEQK